jgi:hypothetical protein
MVLRERIELSASPLPRETGKFFPNLLDMPGIFINEITLPPQKGYDNVRLFWASDPLVRER